MNTEGNVRAKKQGGFIVPPEEDILFHTPLGYDNLLTTELMDNRTGKTSIPCIQMRSKRTPVYDYRNFTKEMGGTWGLTRRNETLLLTPFHIEFPPLQAKIIKPPSSVAGDEYLLYLGTPYVQDWKEVPALSSFLRFLTELQGLAGLSGNFIDKETVSVPEDLIFYHHSLYGLQLRLHISKEIKVKLLSGETKTLETWLNNKQEEKEKEENLPIQTSSWFRVVLYFQGLNYIWWKYNAFMLSEVKEPTRE